VIVELLLALFVCAYFSVCLLVNYATFVFETAFNVDPCLFDYEIFWLLGRLHSTKIALVCQKKISFMV